MLLSTLMRSAAITGRTDSLDTTRVNAFFGGRQGGQWAQQTVASAFPQQAARSQQPAMDAAAGLRDLQDLHARGALTDAELEQLSARLRAQPA